MLQRYFELELHDGAPRASDRAVASPEDADEHVGKVHRSETRPPGTDRTGAEVG